MLRRLVRISLLLGLAALVAAGGYTGYVAVRHARPVTLPGAGGPDPVGRMMFEWTDAGRPDPLAPQPGRPRVLPVWIWYPAAPAPGAEPGPYAPGAWSGLHFGGLPGLGETSFAAVHSRAVDRAPVAAGRFPIVVLEPGLGFAAPQYTALAEMLAADGFIVAGVTPTYSANLAVLGGRPVAATEAGNPSSDGTDLHTGATRANLDRLVAVWAADARFAADQVAALDAGGPLAGHADPARIAYAGHSFGGAAALEACRLDHRCRAAADLDGTQFGEVVHTGLAVPVLIIGAEDSCVTGDCAAPGPADAADRDTARAMLGAGSGPAWCLRLRGARHFNFSDYGAYYLAAPMRALLALGPIDGREALTTTGAYLTAFLGRALRGEWPPLLSAGSTPLPHIVVQRAPQ